MKGHKIDAIIRNNKVSFCVAEQDNVKPDEFITYFRSVVLFGKARIITDESEKIFALLLLTGKYSPAESGTGKEISHGLNHLAIIEIKHLTGKESIELIGIRGLG